MFYNDVLPVLEKECGKILKIYKKNKSFLYRGLSGEKKLFIEKTSRKGVRKPKHTSVEMHRFLNSLFKEKFGWKVRDGISTSTDASQAMWYGNAYIFFPTNRFKFAYSLKIDDLFKELPIIPFAVDTKEWLNKKKRTFNRIVNMYTDKDLHQAINNNSGEVLFKTGKYYLLRRDEFRHIFSDYINKE